jgi:uncharacterized protein (TIGR03435 family)
MHAVRFAGVCVFAACTLFAQPAAFEVASIKPNTSTDFRSIDYHMLPGGRFTATNLPVRLLVSLAYDVPVNPSERISGLPDWTLADRYDIDAKVPDGAVPAGLPDTELHRRMRLMLQALLADRFKAVVRRDTKEMQAYVLLVGKDGPKMKPAELDGKACAADPAEAQTCHRFNGGMGRGLHAKAANMADLAGFIENWTDHPVVNKTGLNGLYSIETPGWTPMRLPPPPTGNVPNPAARPNGDGDMSDPARPTLFMVLQKLGLELKQQKAPIDVYVVEHMEHPAAN